MSVGVIITIPRVRIAVSVIDPPAPEAIQAPFARFGYASASERGWPEGYPNTNLNTGSYRGGRPSSDEAQV